MNDSKFFSASCFPFIFDIWLCSFHAMYPFEQDYFDGVTRGKKGETLVHDGVCVIEFNEIGKIIVVTDILA